MLLSILGPQILGALRHFVSNLPDWRDWKQVSGSLLLLLFCPFHMYIGHFKLIYQELKIKINPHDQSLVKEREILKRTLYIHVKLELGLETVFQLAGKLILLLMAYTKTPTQSGLKTMFKDGEGLDPLTLCLLILSIILSFKSCISSHWKALNACREHFPFKSKCVSALYCLFGCLIRVTSIVIFFVGPLGLFSILRHLQGEQYPWNTRILELVNPDGMMVIGNVPPFKWILIDRWQKNGQLYMHDENDTTIRDFQGNPIPNSNHLVAPPDYTMYVGVHLRYYLFLFITIAGLQTLIVFIAKSHLSKVFMKEFNLLEKFIHCLENTNIPYNAKEWDDGKGDAKEHKKRMQSNWLEVLTVIAINCFFNIILLFSLSYLGMVT